MAQPLQWSRKMHDLIKNEMVRREEERALGLEQILMAYEKAGKSDDRSQQKQHMDMFVSGMNDSKRSLRYRWACFKNYLFYNIFVEEEEVLEVLEKVMIPGTPFDLLTMPFQKHIESDPLKTVLSELFISTITCLSMILGSYGYGSLISRPPRPLLDGLVSTLKAMMRNFKEECLEAPGISDVAERGIAMYETRSAPRLMMPLDKVVESLSAFSDPKWTRAAAEERGFGDVLAALMYYFHEKSPSGKSLAELLPMARAYLKFCDLFWSRKQFPELLRGLTFQSLMDITLSICYLYGKSKVVILSTSWPVQITAMYRVVFRSSMGHCGYCYKANASSKCGKCRLVRYCSPECQKAHWDQHRRFCEGPKTIDEIKEEIMNLPVPPWKLPMPEKYRKNGFLPFDIESLLLTDQ